MKKIILFVFCVGGILAFIYMALLFFFKNIEVEPPLPTITTNGQTIHTERGHYQWEEWGVAVITDMDTFSIQNLIQEHRMTVGVGEKVKIAFPKGLKEQTVVLQEATEKGEETIIPLKNGTFTVPEISGIYTYLLFLSAKDGEANYHFSLEVN